MEVYGPDAADFVDPGDGAGGEVGVGVGGHGAAGVVAEDAVVGGAFVVRGRGGDFLLSVCVRLYEAACSYSSFWGVELFGVFTRRRGGGGGRR